MSGHRLFFLAVVLFAGLLAASPMSDMAQAASLQDEVEAAIMCQCGCNYTLQACASAMGCSVADEMRRVIATQASEGKSKEEIISYFMSLYGQSLLAAPTKKGFNLTAWITPFLALVAGGGVVYALLLAWSRRHAAHSLATARRQAELEHYAAQVEQELEQEREL